MDNVWAHDLDRWFPDRDKSFVPIWGASYSNYSDCAWMVILEKNGLLYEQSYTFSPEAENCNPVWEPYLISYQQAIDLLLEWEEFLD